MTGVDRFLLNLQIRELSRLVVSEKTPLAKSTQMGREPKGRVK